MKRLSDLKKDEFFRFKGKKKVYTYQGGGPKRGFKYIPEDDFCDEKVTKNNREVETDFDY